MKIGVIGPESSGGRYLERLISCTKECPEVYHWSVPYGPSRGDRFWPTERCPELIKSMDKIIVTVRDWHPMVLSASKEHTNDLYEANYNARKAFIDILGVIRDHPDWRFVTYESLSSGGSISRLFEWLGLTSLDVEPFADGNMKWYIKDWK